jgi:hypothetical protein
LVFCFERGDESALLGDLLSSFHLLSLHISQLCLDSLHLFLSALTFPAYALQSAPE